jgi:hypothetical protein
MNDATALVRAHSFLHPFITPSVIRKADLPTTPLHSKTTETVSDPEARAICERGLAQLQRLDKACKDALGGEDGEVEAIKADQGKVLGLIQAACGQGDAVFAVSQDYLASICCSLVDGRVKEPEKVSHA